MRKILRPEFSKKFMGFNPKEVMEYVTSLESELEISDVQLEKTRKEADTLRAENDRLSNQQAALRSDVDYLQDENHELLKSNQELEDQLLQVKEERLANQTNQTVHDQLQAKNDALQAELEEAKAALHDHEEKEQQLANQNHLLTQQLQKKEAELAELRRLSQSDADPKAISDALISAQRMGNIILAEANEKAAELRAEAEDAYQNAMNVMEQQIQERQQHADAITADAEQKCEDLRKEYDHILMDVSGFKQEMIGLYRKHLQMLYLLPDNGSVKENPLELEHITEDNAQ